jgi:hypothetical protein
MTYEHLPAYSIRQGLYPLDLGFLQSGATDVEAPDVRECYFVSVNPEHLG